MNSNSATCPLPCVFLCSTSPPAAWEVKCCVAVAGGSTGAAVCPARVGCSTNLSEGSWGENGEREQSSNNHPPGRRGPAIEEKEGSSVCHIT